MNPEGPIIIAISAMFGVVLGSFLNVCIYRLPLGLTPWHPARSFCPRCDAPIAWYDNIPVLSFLLLRGRCHHCAERIPYRYLIVELTVGVAFALVISRFGLSLEALKWCLLASLLISLFWTDLESRFLPDEFTLGGTLAGAVLAAFLPPVSIIPISVLGSFLPDSSRVQSVAAAVCSALVLALPLLLVGWFYSRLRGRQGLGFGDVKLLLLIGVFFGVERGVRVLVLACVVGSVCGLAYIRLRRLDPKSYGLPLGSFISAGALLALLGAF